MQSIGFQMPFIVNRAFAQKNDSGSGHSKKSLQQNAELTTSPVNSAYHYHPVHFSGNGDVKGRTKKIKTDYLPKLIKGLPLTSTGHTITMDDFDLTTISHLKDPTDQKLGEVQKEISRNLKEQNSSSIKVIFVEHVETDNWEKRIQADKVDNIVAITSQQEETLSLNEIEQFLNTGKNNTVNKHKNPISWVSFPVGDTGNKTLVLISTDVDKMKVFTNEYKRQALIEKNKSSNK